jgi:HlyD family secretion protein
MDRPLDATFVRQRLTARGVKVAAIVAVSAGVLLGARALMRPSVSRARLRIAAVDEGPIAATVSASGTVLPEAEQVISSPIDTRVLSILRRAGARVAADEPILTLDAAEPALALEKLRQSLALKDNQQARARLDLTGTLASLGSQVEIKKLQLETYEASAERNRKLFAEGLVSEEVFRQSKLDAARTKLELAQVGEARDLAVRSAAAQEEALRLERDTLTKEVREAERQIRLATARATGPGVVTWVLPDAGASVHRGDALARVADLSSYRVEATVADVHATKLRAGLPAVATVNGVRLAGAVARVFPTVQNGGVVVEIALEDRSNAVLKPSLRADVELVLDRKEKALRLPRGIFPGTGLAPAVFVVRGDTAVRTPVTFGLSNAEAWEVRSGLAAGDVVILSDMSDYGHLAKVTIR